MSHSRQTRAAIYLRVSLDSTGEQLAVGRQREDCRKIAADRGWHVVEEYADNSISASDRTKSRPAYDRMVEDFRRGSFDALVCWDLDRLTRLPRQLEDWIDASEDRGLLLVTANGEADLSTDNGRLFARIKASVARAEVERKSARQQRALRQRAENGRPPLGVRLTGYTTAGDVIEHEADVVRQIFTAFAAGESLRGISRTLTEAGVPTRRGQPWSPSSVRTILTNPRYAGHAVYRRETLPAAATWEPLVDAETFGLVQHRLTDPRRATNREGTDRKHLGSGLYLCQCGRKVRGWSGGRYRCAGGCYSRSAAHVDTFVELVIRERLSRPDLADALAGQRGADRGEDLTREAKRLRSRLAVIEGDYDAGHIDGRRYATAREKIMAELETVERQRGASAATSGPASILDAADPAAAYDAASLMIRRATVDFFANVTLRPALRGSKAFDPASVAIEWRV